MRSKECIQCRVHSFTPLDSILLYEIDDSVGVRDLGTMSSETYLRRARAFANRHVQVSELEQRALGYNSESMENRQPLTVNTVHLPNSYKTLQSFEGFNNSKSKTLKVRNSYFQRAYDHRSQDKLNFSTRRNLQIQKENTNEYNTKENNNEQSCLKKLKICTIAQEYCANSSLHGLRYVGDSHLVLMEKLFWLLSFICAFASATYFIWHVYNKWIDSPIIISMSPEPVSYNQFPFPSITICNMNNAKRTEAHRIINGSDPLEKLLLEDICNFPNISGGESSIYGAADWNNVLHFMINVTQPCTDMLYYCQWRGNTTDCEEIFNPTLTDEGMCCNFNTVHKKYLFYNPLDWSDLNITYPYPMMDWKPETGYNDTVHLDTQPWRPYGAGSYWGLSLALDTESNDYYCSSTSGVGFKMLLHNPVETPKIADFGFALSPGKETRIVITPRIYSASWSILGISRKKRKCFFTTERRLKYYRTYTQRNCLLECEANFTQKICHCVQYYMPKSANTPICGKKDDICATDARRLMETNLYDDETTAGKLNVTETPSCNCWPGCFEINYDYTMSHSMLVPTFYTDESYIKKNKTYFTNNMAVVHLYFVESQFPKYVKSELFGFIDFLSNIGGLLGLFMGFSFLSAVEVIYFMTLRVWCRICDSNITTPRNSTSLIHVKATNPNSKIIYPFSQ
ncbi:hypothetical protein PV327_001254 [Microctonus hyperodae]|uniref:Sodium channel protein Nach n=1 Tax=Microctonus hyperodae TaxID=165561 RepID=A0AA39L2S4_MICHY|nr:hypothetical protein PV327_001254 [Microctonus hyperodae]